MNKEQIFNNNRAWVAKKLETDSRYFKKLAEGQNPHFLYIGCSDSRVSAEDLMGVEPGDIFVHRNIANMVPNNDLNVMSVVNYAIDHLGVNDIIVCGHYGCGGVKAAMQSADLGLLNPWLRNIRDVYRLHKNELNNVSDETDRYRRLVELNVQEQCLNIIKTAVVQRASKTRELRVHGWVFDLESGKLIDLEIDFDSMLNEVMEIYKLDDV
jgi:carbonic anhydrase